MKTFFEECKYSHENHTLFPSWPSSLETRISKGNYENINMLNDNGETLLMVACKWCPSIVSTLLKAGINVDIKDKKGQTAIMIACRYNSFIVPELIYSADAQINISNKRNGNTPLIMACKYNPSIVNVLLKNGAQINICNYYGWTPLMIACKYSHPSVVDMLLNIRNETLINTYNYFGWTPLMIACKYNPSVVGRLIKANAKINAQNKRNGDTPLMIACKYNHSVVDVLLKNGAHVNILNYRGWTPLMMACRYNICLVSKLIIACSKIGILPLVIICKFNPNFIIICHLIRANNNILNKDNKKMIISLACENNPSLTLKQFENYI